MGSGGMGTKRGEPWVNSGKKSKLPTVKVSGKVFPSRKTVNVMESLRGRDWLANCPKI